MPTPADVWDALARAGLDVLSVSSDRQEHLRVELINEERGGIERAQDLAKRLYPRARVEVLAVPESVAFQP